MLYAYLLKDSSPLRKVSFTIKNVLVSFGGSWKWDLKKKLPIRTNYGRMTMIIRNHFPVYFFTMAILDLYYGADTNVQIKNFVQGFLRNELTIMTNIKEAMSTHITMHRLIIEELRSQITYLLLFKKTYECI